MAPCCDGPKERGRAPGYTFVVPVRNKASVLKEAVGSVIGAAQRHGAAAVVLVDDGSTDGSSSLLATLADGSKVTVVSTGRKRSAHGRRVGVARNTGASQARGGVLCFVDADCVVPLDYLERVAAALPLERPAAVGYPTRLPAGMGWLAETWLELQQPGGVDSLWLPGANLVVDRVAFDAVGGFDETLESYEDVDICMRLRAAGYPVVAAERLEVVHLDEPQTPAAFVRRQFRYGLGAFSRRSLATLERGSLATVVHVTFVIAGLACLAVAPWSGPSRAAAAVAGWFAVPCAAVVARVVAGIRARRALRAVALYHLYFLARSMALVVTVGRLAARVVRREPATGPERFDGTLSSPRTRRRGAVRE